MISIEQAIYNKLHASDVAASATIYQLQAPEDTPPTPFVVFYITNTQLNQAQSGRNRLREGLLVVHILHTRLKTLATIREQVIDTLDGWTDNTVGVQKCRADYYENEEGTVNDVITFDERIYFDVVFERPRTSTYTIIMSGGAKLNSTATPRVTYQPTPMGGVKCAGVAIVERIRGGGDGGLGGGIEPGDGIPQP